MKRILSLLLVCVALLSLCSMAFATEITNNTSNSANITVQYGVDSSYSVTIPESATINAAGMGTLTVSVSNALLERSSLLTVQIRGDSYRDGYWHLTDKRHNDNQLKYNIICDNNVVMNEDVICRVAAGEAYNRTVSSVMDLLLNEDKVLAGTYVDALTFVVDVHKHVNTNGDALCDNCGSIMETVDIPLKNGANGMMMAAPPSANTNTPAFADPAADVNVLEVTIGDFKATTEMKPGEYETIPHYDYYIEMTNRPQKFTGYAISGWYEEFNANDEMTAAAPADVITLDMVPYMGDYIVYEPGVYYTVNHDVFTDVVNNKAWPVYVVANPTLENTLNSLAFQKFYGTGTIPYNWVNADNLVVCHWNGTKYEVVNYSDEINALCKNETWYTTTEVVTYEKVLVHGPSLNTELAYIPTTTTKFEENMTWAEWFASPYNNTGLTSATVKTSDYEDVALTEVIDPSKEYAIIGLTNAVSGKWELDMNVTFPFEVAQNDVYLEMVNFTIDGKQYEGFQFECIYLPGPKRTTYNISGQYVNHQGALTFYSGSITSMSWVKYTNTLVFDFGSTPQTVSPEFYEWLHTYGTPIS